jgi:hypothetical protein
VLTAVLSALVLAAGIYRLVAFGHLNKLRAGGSTVQILTGESETFPTKAEVEEDARSKASHDGKLSHLNCHQVASYTVWSCLLRFVGGVTEAYRGVWYESESRIAFSLAQYKRPGISRFRLVRIRLRSKEKPTKRATSNKRRRELALDLWVSRPSRSNCPTSQCRVSVGTSAKTKP